MRYETSEEFYDRPIYTNAYRPITDLLTYVEPSELPGATFKATVNGVDVWVGDDGILYGVIL